MHENCANFRDRHLVTPGRLLAMVSYLLYNSRYLYVYACEKYKAHINLNYLIYTEYTDTLTK